MRLIFLTGAIFLFHSSEEASSSVLRKHNIRKSENAVANEVTAPRITTVTVNGRNTDPVLDSKKQLSLSNIKGNIGGEITSQMLNNKSFIRRPRGIIRPSFRRKFNKLGRFGGRLFRSGGFFKVGNIDYSGRSFESEESNESFENSLEYDYSEESSGSDENDSREFHDSGEESDSFEYFGSEELSNSGESSGSFEYLDFDYAEDSSRSDEGGSIELNSSEFEDSGEHARFRYSNNGKSSHIPEVKVIRFAGDKGLPDKIEVPSLGLIKSGYRLKKTSIIQDLPSSVYKGNLNYKYSLKGKDPKRKSLLPILLKSPENKYYSGISW
ncbi:UNVERIFIED_CONTAM: hypothetical protein RMT77_002341 [Armadillidium vulgare]